MRRGDPGIGLVFAVLLTGLAAGCGEEAVPAHPAFEPTMREFFASHCVRCHGAGGTLNIDPLVYGGTSAPTQLHLDQYGDLGDCTFDPVSMTIPASCKRGALYLKDAIKLYANSTGGMRMPPAPSDPLTDWEKELVTRWCDDPREN